ncbi:MAG TPA: hypothetical protein VGL50_02325 [Steroidobacteraceae bacterium]|jgi:pyruvate/2-oxoglutarate dehydrogenase complex dihydrolipoamide acyltransferase (E2) component
MSKLISAGALLAGLLFVATGFADAPPADAPAGATGLCKDGTYWTNATKKGACHGHKGIQTWYADSSAGGAAASAPAAAPAAAPAPAPTSAPAAAPKTTSSAPKSTATPPANAASGGGPGLVWVNSSSKVYHCPSDRWYGKTKNGSYMSEAQAKAQGNRPDHGKTCQ